MSLPKWIQNIQFSDRDQQNLWEAFQVAFSALEDIANHEQSKWDFERHTAIKAMREIEEMGK